MALPQTRLCLPVPRGGFVVLCCAAARAKPRRALQEGKRPRAASLSMRVARTAALGDAAAKDFFRALSRRKMSRFTGGFQQRTRRERLMRSSRAASLEVDLAVFSDAAGLCALENKMENYSTTSQRAFEKIDRSFAGRERSLRWRPGQRPTPTPTIPIFVKPEDVPPLGSRFFAAPASRAKWSPAIPPMMMPRCMHSTAS